MKEQTFSRIRVALICGFSNPEVNGLLNPGYSPMHRFFRKLRGLSCQLEFMENSVWVTHAIREFELHTDQIELHVISPYSHIHKDLVEFDIRGIHYHFVNNEFDLFLTTLKRNLCRNKDNVNSEYRHNRKWISRVLHRIKPDIVHMMGAEVPTYALSMLDVLPGIPKIVQLQTLLSDSEFETSYTLEHQLYEYRSRCEMECIKCSDYIGTRVEKFRNLLTQQLGTLSFLDTTLALAEPVDITARETEYDFVYFAKEIEKAADFAIEAFALAHEKHPEITLDIVGGYGAAFKARLDARIQELGIAGSVFFEGSQPTHEDVIRQIRKSRFAVIPIKVDLITGTVRESMANGLPVVTNITPATPKLNLKAQSVLLSEKGDHAAMAENMCLLLENENLADSLRQHAADYMNERAGNADVVRHYIASYQRILTSHGVSKD